MSCVMRSCPAPRNARWSRPATGSGWACPRAVFIWWTAASLAGADICGLKDRQSNKQQHSTRGTRSNIEFSVQGPHPLAQQKKTNVTHIAITIEAYSVVLY